jgi:hypothetical protein
MTEYRTPGNRRGQSSISWSIAMHKSYPFYNVSFSVGRNGENYMDDVALVQYMIMKVASHPSQKIVLPPDTPLTVNGAYSSLVDDWIEWFQNETAAHGKTVTVDGRIDPAPAPSKDGYCLKSTRFASWTIIHLNATLRRRFRTEHNNLENQPELVGYSDQMVSDDYAPAAAA